MSRHTMPNVKITKDVLSEVERNCSLGTRHEFPKTEGEYEIAYGLDHACGWFISLVPVMDDGEVDYDNAYEMDTLFTGLTGAELGFLLRQFDGNVHHISKAYLDLEF